MTKTKRAGVAAPDILFFDKRNRQTDDIAKVSKAVLIQGGQRYERKIDARLGEEARLNVLEGWIDSFQAKRKTGKIARPSTAKDKRNIARPLIKPLDPKLPAKKIERKSLQKLTPAQFLNLLETAKPAQVEQISKLLSHKEIDNLLRIAERDTPKPKPAKPKAKAAPAKAKAAKPKPEPEPEPEDEYEPPAEVLAALEDDIDHVVGFQLMPDEMAAPSRFFPHGPYADAEVEVYTYNFLAKDMSDLRLTDDNISRFNDQLFYYILEALTDTLKNRRGTINFNMKLEMPVDVGDDMAIIKPKWFSTIRHKLYPSRNMPAFASGIHSELTQKLHAYLTELGLIAKTLTIEFLDDNEKARVQRLNR